jgi:flagellar hook-length control protein FliK
MRPPEIAFEMSELIAFFAPTVLPAAAATVARASEGAAPAGSFANILANLQLASNGAEPSLALPVQLATDDVTAKLQALGLLPANGDAANAPNIPAGQITPITNLEALLAAVSPGEPAAPAKDGAVEPGQLIAALATTLQQVPEVPPAPAPSPAAPFAAQPELVLRGTIVADQAATNALPLDAAKLPAETRTAEAQALAVPPSLLAPKTEPASQNRNTSPAAKPVLKGEASKLVDQASAAVATAAPQQTTTAIDPLARELAGQGQQQQASLQPYAAAPAQPQAVSADTALPVNNPQAAAVVPAPVLPTLIDAQQMSATVVSTPQAAVPLDTLAVHIARKFEAGASQFEIRLHPMELGQLDISLSVAEDGRIQAVLRAERPETLDMLQRDARVLEQQLRQAGLDVGANSLSFSLSSGNGQRPAPFVGWPGFADAQDAQGAAKNDAASTYLAVRKRDGLDIRI